MLVYFVIFDGNHYMHTPKKMIQYAVKPFTGFI